MNLAKFNVTFSVSLSSPPEPPVETLVIGERVNQPNEIVEAFLGERRNRHG